MLIKKLWTKLFARKDSIQNISSHVSGRTIRHENPFEGIEVPRNKEGLTEEFINMWVVPFYMSSLSNSDDTEVNAFARTAKEIDTDIIARLLGDNDWRARIVGAFFSAIGNYRDFEGLIGKHLLKSEVCYAGYGYSLALAAFGSDNAKRYLFTYLDYYLDRKDLWFDQADAFCALEYLDKNQADKLGNKWDNFVADKEYWSLDKSREHFAKSILTLDKIRKAKNK